MNRRTLLAATVPCAFIATATFGEEASASKRQLTITDTNISLFRWPFRRLPLDEPGNLLEKMKTLGISRAWAGSFEGILHRDIAGVNRRLADACRKHRELIPIGSVNPALPDWQHDLAECAETHGMPGIRLHPNYHGYTLEDPAFAKLLRLSVEKGLFIQLAALLEDTRTQPAKLQAPDVDLAPLPAILKQLPEARVQILNWRPRGATLEELAETPGVCFDIARTDATDGVARLIESAGLERVMFGTHAPFLIPEASLIRVHESDLPEASLNAILQDNAARFLKR